MNIILSVLIALHLFTVIPQASPTDVTEEKDAVSQNLWVEQYYGAVGILAHNSLAGQYFDDLTPGDEITITVYDPEREREYERVFEVVEIKRYQALSPDQTWGEYIDLETGERLSTAGVLAAVYAPGSLVLQTCISQGSERSWGRLFAITKESEEK
jgi:hypothetical protein